MSWNRKKSNLVQKTLGLKEEIVPVDLQDNALIMNELDKDIYHDMVDSYEAMSENLDSGLKEYAPFEHLSEDMFNSLFKYNAKMHESDEMKSFSRFNHKIMENLMESEDYEKLRKSTKFDLMGSAIGTEVMQQKAMDQINYFKSQYQQQKDTGQPMDDAAAGELIEQLNQQGQLQNQIDTLNNLNMPGGPGLTQTQANQLAQLQQQFMDLQNLIDGNVDGQEQLEDGMTNAMNDASHDAANEVSEVRDIVDSWGLDSGQSSRRISLDKRKKAIERIRRSNRLKELTDLIGRMKKVAMQKKKQKQPDGYSIKTIELGNQLEKVVPSELMKLANPSTKKDFVQRFHEKQLMQYKKNSIKSTGRGPVIVLHDKSGSMDGHKDDWSTALSLATLEVAQKEKRNYGYIPYESIVIQNMVKNIPAGELDPDDIMDIAEMSTRGGTNFMAPMNEAINCLTSDRYKKGDILFITDGDCGVTDQWLAEFKRKKEELKFYVNTVLINIGGGASRGTIEKFSDNIVTISHLTDLDEANAAKIFNIIEDEHKYADADEDGDDGSLGN
jgi:uncharacterized protein with von Willebrand factor type A (vWA) domain